MESHRREVSVPNFPTNARARNRQEQAIYFLAVGRGQTEVIRALPLPAFVVITRCKYAFVTPRVQIRALVQQRNRMQMTNSATQNEVVLGYC